MDPEHQLYASAELAARQDRLEQQVAQLSLKLDALERHLAPAEPATPHPPAPPLPSPLPPTIPPSPPPLAPGASLENRLGSQVFNRIGIVALLIGATWFLKLAIDNQWIGATGRVLIGLLAGAALVLWSERFRRKGFAAFSYSLKAIGSGVLYLALWASFQLYHLLPPTVVLAGMLLVTGWNAWMAWAQNAELLAAYALAGGISTPLLLSTGGNHEVFLFTYLLSIDIASVTLSRLKAWPRLVAAALPASIAYFIGWYSSFYTAPLLGVTSLFILLFFAVFTAAAFTPPPDRSPAPEGREAPSAISSTSLIQNVFLPIVTAAFGSLALYSVLQDSGHHDLLPWLMLCFAAVYLGLMRLPQPPVTAAIHLSLAIVFLTVAIPLKASGAWITVGWLAEGVALLWVSTRLLPLSSVPARVLRILSSAALLLGFGGVLTELFRQSWLAHVLTFFNRGFSTALVALGAFALAVLIARRASASHLNVPQLTPTLPEIASAAFIAFNLTAVIAGVIQIDSLWTQGTQGSDAALERALAVSAFLMLYGAILLAVGFWQRRAFIRWQALLLLVLTIAKTFLYDMRNLSQGYRVLSFLGLGALLMTVSFAYQKDWLALRDPLVAPSDPRGHPE